MQDKKKQEPKQDLKTRFISAVRRNYITSYFLICMIIGWIADLFLGTMPKYSVTGMVVGAILGSCLNTKRRSDEKERELRESGKKLL